MWVILMCVVKRRVLHSGTLTIIRHCCCNIIIGMLLIIWYSVFWIGWSEFSIALWDSVVFDIMATWIHHPCYVISHDNYVMLRQCKIKQGCLCIEILMLRDLEASHVFFNTAVARVLKKWLLAPQNLGVKNAQFVDDNIISANFKYEKHLSRRTWKTGTCWSAETTDVSCWCYC
jgi:hypothetical protein